MQKVNLKGLDLNELRDFVVSIDEKPFRGDQIFSWLYNKSINSFDEMTNLSKELRDKLLERAQIDQLKLVVQRQSGQDQSIKYLFQLEDDSQIESVLMFDGNRATLCISTQVGCAIDCKFCATGVMGLNRHLTPGEILDQVLAVQKLNGTRVTNVVCMGMGEPFANYDNTLAAVGILNDDDGVRLGARHMTISTVGLVPQILKLADEPYQINLAISLHAPNDKIRSATMPINRRYPIERIMRACRTYISKTNRRVSFEYVLLSGENDRPEHAEELGELLKGMLCHVNLIPVNATDAGYTRPPDGRIGKFRDILKRSGIAVTVRFEKGTDIDAGCGQLRARALTGAN